MKKREGEHRRVAERRPRGSGRPLRVPELGYYCIITDTEETEKNYLDGLKQALPERVRDRLVIKVRSAATGDLIDEAEKQASLNPQYAQPWIVFDHDQVKNFDEIIAEAKRRGIKVGWSNPCIEIWFHAYYGEMPSFPGGLTASKACWHSFSEAYKKHAGRKYDKADKTIYDRLFRTGDEVRAIRMAEEKYHNYKKDGKKKPSEMESATTLHRLVADIRGKIDCE